MAVKQFSKQEFENALPVHRKTGRKLWTYFGFKDLEHCYLVETKNPNFFVFVRSSVDGRDVSGETGENSIRLFLTDSAANPLSNKISLYITRANGWEERMKKQLRFWCKLVLDATKSSNGMVTGIFKSKKEGPNKGRFFFKINERFGGWID